MDAKDTRKLLPLTPLSFQILMALADGDRHGYGVIKEIEGRTEGFVRPATGTLYAAIQRLMDQDLIVESDWRPDDPDQDDERRRYYRLTEFGRRVAEAEARRLSRIIEVAHEKRLLV